MTRMMILIAAIGVAACDKDSRNISEREAIDIASLYAKKNYPESKGTTMRPDAHDQGTTWIVTYELPENSIGGTPTIEVDKATGRVLYARHTQ